MGACVLQAKGISIRVASPKLVMEESPESYKDVTQVVETCHQAGLSYLPTYLLTYIETPLRPSRPPQAGISKKCVKLRPIAVIKG